MLKSIIIYDSKETAAGMGEIVLFKKTLLEHDIQVEMLEIHGESPNHEYYFEILRQDPDMVFTVNFAGFAMRTDTGEAAFINLTCRSAHLILNDNDKEFEQYLSGKLSIAMSFYCRNDNIYDKLFAKYQDIPELKKVSEWKEIVEDMLNE